MSASDEGYRNARHRMCSRLRDSGVLRQAAVEAAFRDVPREAFVPADTPGAVYADAVIPVTDASGHWRTTSSQPGMMVIMLEQLELKPGHRVLEIGAGTGYNAAIIDHIVGSDGAVDSVELDPLAAEAATAALRATGSRARVHEADGADGWPNGAPYDRIISTVAVWDVPEVWFAQCASGGRIVAPLTVVGSEYSVSLEREGERWVSRSLSPCGFVRFRGRMAHPDARLTYGRGPMPVLMLQSEPGELPDTGQMDQWLEEGVGEPLRRSPTREAWDGFVLWVLLRYGPLRVARVESSGRELGWAGSGLALWDSDGLGVLTMTGTLYQYGADSAAGTLRGLHESWTSAGAPGLGAFRLAVEPSVTVAGPGALPRWSHTVRIEVARV